MAAKHLGFISHFLGPDAPLEPKYVACNSLIMTCSGFVLFFLSFQWTSTILNFQLEMFTCNFHLSVFLVGTLKPNRRHRPLIPHFFFVNRKLNPDGM